MVGPGCPRLGPILPGPRCLAELLEIRRIPAQQHLKHDKDEVAVGVGVPWAPFKGGLDTCESKVNKIEKKKQLVLWDSKSLKEHCRIRAKLLYSIMQKDFFGYRSYIFKHLLKVFSCRCFPCNSRHATEFVDNFHIDLGEVMCFRWSTSFSRTFSAL